MKQVITPEYLTICVERDEALERIAVLEVEQDRLREVLQRVMDAELVEIETLEESNKRLRNEIAAMYNIPGILELVENDK